MQVVLSRHPSLHDFKYINDASSVLMASQKQDEPIYQELMPIYQIIPTPPKDYSNDVDEDKENRPPLMPIQLPKSRIPVWTPSPTTKNKTLEETKKKSTVKPCLTGRQISVRLKICLSFIFIKNYSMNGRGCRLNSKNYYRQRVKCHFESVFIYILPNCFVISNQFALIHV